MADKWVKIASLWRGKKKGVMTGTLGGKYGAKIVLLTNDKSDKEDSFPDFTVYAVPYSDDEGDDKSDDRKVDDDDIPF